MHAVKPAPWSSGVSEDSSVLSYDLERSGDSLLRLKSHFPETYGYVAYQDPYIDFIAVAILVIGYPTVTTWTGTYREFQARWETFLLKGAG